jgi:hypothetical protein
LKRCRNGSKQAHRSADFQKKNSKEKIKRGTMVIIAAVVAHAS